MRVANTHDDLHPGKLYHIYNRGNNKENLFIERENYLSFLHLWRKYTAPAADTFAYSLLGNHFHFLIRINEEPVPDHKDVLTAGTPFKPIVQRFSNLFNAYAKGFNKRYNRTGSLFQERFRRKTIDNNADFGEVIFYIHSNAQRHGLINDFRSIRTLLFYLYYLKTPRS
jgi:REP element-mobilizing transposase RayT